MSVQVASPARAASALMALGLCLALLVPPLPSAARSTAGRYSAEQGPLYQVGEIELIYATGHPAHPPLELLYSVDLALGNAGDGFVGPRMGGQNLWFTLRELPAGPPIEIYASGLRELAEQLVSELNALGLMGVYVAPHEQDIQPDTGHDLRPPGQTRLRLVIYTGRVRGLRTFAAGAGGDQARVNDPEHERIRELSPVHAGAPTGVGAAAGVAGAGPDGDLILRRELDEYLAYLNRHPGRRVDMNVTPSREPGGVYLDYLVAESKPWQVYAQVANTGTESTGEWRQRLGFSHYQLTGHDDVAHIDYVTGADGLGPEFNGDVQAWFGSYDFPLWSSRRTRAGFNGSWSEYDASQLGFPDGTFTGSQWSVASELTATVMQREDLFVDALAGARWLDVEVKNFDLPSASDQFFVPYFGARVERLRDTSTFVASLGFERSLPGVAGSDLSSEEAQIFGRSDLDDDWFMATWDVLLSFYLEPLLWPRSWRNGRTHEGSTLAHELWFSLRGQDAFGYRLIPQVQRTLGGLYTVRGYDQSLVVGDSVWNLQSEYRLHIPRLLRPGRPVVLPVFGAFRQRPEVVFGRPDWDLIARVFYDAGHTHQSDAVPGEEDQTLTSVGLGLELSLYRYIALRFDYGWALSDLNAFQVERGDGEGWFSATLRY